MELSLASTSGDDLSRRSRCGRATHDPSPLIAGTACDPGRMSKQFAQMLTGGHPNSLGRTEEVVAVVLADQARLEELFATMTSEDEVVRLRVGDALEKVCREQPGWFLGHIDRLLSDLGEINQPSVQWHVAQMMQRLRRELSADQAHRATALLQRYLTSSADWIVLNVTMDVLSCWADRDPQLAIWLVPELDRLSQDGRKSVAKRATRRLAELSNRGRRGNAGSHEV
jgi:hypothetical protein